MLVQCLAASPSGGSGAGAKEGKKEKIREKMGEGDNTEEGNVRRSEGAGRGVGGKLRNISVKGDRYIVEGLYPKSKQISKQTTKDFQIQH